MDIMDRYLAFFAAHIDPAFREDTNTRIGNTLIALAYPDVILIGPPPFFRNAVVDVRKEGLEIEPDEYPLYRFLDENPEICERLVRDHEELGRFFARWNRQA
ncbi:hypothetical protein [Thauera sinica]|uniref:Uncharacterized protein n=1 Tax=Thauera sinica TaxID=2665146 RepID=A0ABW1ALX2_9RHOO|nr:hypothetical protein [Thauera sp. K11]